MNFLVWIADTLLLVSPIFGYVHRYHTLVSQTLQFEQLSSLIRVHAYVIASNYFKHYVGISLACGYLPRFSYLRIF